MSKLLQASELINGFSKYGDKGNVWSNAEGTEGVHIKQDGFNATTLCGTSMLASNWAASRDKGLGAQYDYDSIGCIKCREIYQVMLEEAACVACGELECFDPPVCADIIAKGIY